MPQANLAPSGLFAANRRVFELGPGLAGRLSARRMASGALIPLGVFLGLFLLMFVAVLFGARSAARKRRALLQATAQRLGLEYHAPPDSFLQMAEPKVMGRYRGRFARVYTFTTGSGKSRTTWSAVAVQGENPNGLKLKLRTQGPAFLEKIAQAFGFQDVVVGDPRFDAQFVVSTNDAEFIRAALLPELRQQLLELWRNKGRGAKIELESGECVYAETGDVSDAKRLARLEAALPVIANLAALAEVYRR
jgi:hypothetical protein